MAAVTICSDPRKQSRSLFPLFPYLFAMNLRQSISRQVDKKSGVSKGEIGSGILKEEEKTTPHPHPLTFLSLSKDYITTM